LNEPSQLANLPTELTAEEIKSLMQEHDSPYGRISHLAQKREHPARILFAIGPYGHRAEISHHPGTFCGRVSVAALRQKRPEAHRSQRRQTASDRRFKCHLHLG